MACFLTTTVALWGWHIAADSLHDQTDPRVLMMPLWHPVLLHLVSVCWQAQETQMCHVQLHVFQGCSDPTFHAS